MKTALLVALSGLIGSGFAGEARNVPASPLTQVSSSPARPAAAGMEAVDIKVRSRHRLMEVQVELASGADSDTRFEYSAQWFDAEGYLIPSFVGSWFAGDLPGLGTALIHEMAPSPDAVRCTIVCRETSRDNQRLSPAHPLSLCINSK